MSGLYYADRLEIALAASLKKYANKRHQELLMENIEQDIELLRMVIYQIYNAKYDSLLLRSHILGDYFTQDGVIII